MSDHRAPLGGIHRDMLRLLAAAGSFVVLLGAPLRAQSAADVTQRIAQMQDSIRATQVRLESARNRHTLAADDSIIADGVTVQFPSLAISEQDRAALRAGIAAGRRSLAKEYGEAASQLVDGDRWSVMFWTERNGRYETASLLAGPDMSSIQRQYVRMPLKADAIAAFVRDRAGHRLAVRDSIIAAFIGGGFTLEPQERAFYMARRHLVTSRSSVARRCADGALGACRTIFDARASDRWFAPEDSVRGDGRPFPRWVNGTVVQVALEMGGPRAIERLASPAPAEDAISRLAAAAGTTPDSLLIAWSGKLQEGTDQNASPSLPLAASAAFWCGLFLLAATRRRPR